MKNTSAIREKLNTRGNKRSNLFPLDVLELSDGPRPYNMLHKQTADAQKANTACQKHLLPPTSNTEFIQS